MQAFYKKALLALICLVVANAFLAFFLIVQSYLSVPVLASDKAAPGWHYITNSDIEIGGASTVRIPDPQRKQLRYEFRLSEAGKYPFASAGMALHDAKGRPA